MGSAGVVSKPHYSLKAVSLKMAPTVNVGRMHVQGEGGGEEPSIAKVQLSGQAQAQAVVIATW